MAFLFSCDEMLHFSFRQKVFNTVFIIPDCYYVAPIFILNRSSVFIETNFLWHDFRNGEGLECSNSESDTRQIR